MGVFRKKKRKKMPQNKLFKKGKNPKPLEVKHKAPKVKKGAPPKAPKKLKAILEAQELNQVSKVINKRIEASVLGQAKQATTGLRIFGKDTNNNTNPTNNKK
eukprot:c7164_g1_i2.p1 GENE.c7164_g1_i2~~c7164_g1_i2.p1  ORF type:complete len:102 (+),score=25.62 c7164_g1_i2:2-307(+)